MGGVGWRGGAADRLSFKYVPFELFVSLMYTFVPSAQISACERDSTFESKIAFVCDGLVLFGTARPT
jgi:hypothetical protein